MRSSTSKRDARAGEFLVHLPLEGPRSENTGMRRENGARRGLELGVWEASVLLDLSEVLVIRRMEIGELPFRWEEGERWVRAVDVIALREKLRAQKAAMRELVELGEEIEREMGE